MKRCKVARIDITAGDVSEAVWAGHEVDLDRELKPGVTIGDAVAGREDAWFEDVDGIPGKAIESGPDAPRLDPDAPSGQYVTAVGRGLVPSDFHPVLVDPDTDFSNAVFTPIPVPDVVEE